MSNNKEFKYKWLRADNYWKNRKVFKGINSASVKKMLIENEPTNLNVGIKTLKFFVP
jgi:hypothetical protein